MNFYNTIINDHRIQHCYNSTPKFKFSNSSIPSERSHDTPHPFSTHPHSNPGTYAPKLSTLFLSHHRAPYARAHVILFNYVIPVIRTSAEDDYLCLSPHSLRDTAVRKVRRRRRAAFIPESHYGIIATRLIRARLLLPRNYRGREREREIMNFPSPPNCALLGSFRVMEFLSFRASLYVSSFVSLLFERYSACDRGANSISGVWFNGGRVSCFANEFIIMKFLRVWWDILISVLIESEATVLKRNSFFKRNEYSDYHYILKRFVKSVISIVISAVEQMTLPTF